MVMETDQREEEESGFRSAALQVEVRAAHQIRKRMINRKMDIDTDR
jgi:hypothetical protein